MKVYVNENEKKLYSAMTYSPPYQKRKSVNYVCVTEEFIEKIAIIFDEKVKHVVIRPLRYETEYKIINENTVELYIKKYANFSVEPNGNIDGALLLFCGKAQNVLKEKYQNIIYFKKGRHFLDTLNITQDNTLVYFEDGAVVDGQIIFKGCNNVAADGFGTLTYEKYNNRTRLMHFNNCSNVEVRNIVVKDSTNWNVVLMGCENVHIDNVKIIGYHGNSDGIDVCGSKNVLIENCFTRVWDDSLVVKGFDTGNIDNVTFKNCVLWNDFARPMEVGVEVRADEAKNILFKDIDVIHSMTRYPIMGIHHGDRACIKNVYFENITVEDTPGAQLVDLRITHSAWNKDNKMGNISYVKFKNINILSNGNFNELPYRSRIKGYSRENSISDVIFENICTNGKYAENLEQLGVNVSDYVSNVKVICNKEPKIRRIKTSIITQCTHLSSGYYEVKVKTVFKNTSDEHKKGQCILNISPSHKVSFDNKINYDIKPNDCAEYNKKVILPPSKYALSLSANNFDFENSIEYINLDMVLGKDYSYCPPYVFNDGYGNKYSDKVYFALHNGVIKIKSELLKKYNMVFYATQTPKNCDDCEMLFSIEQTNEGKAPAILYGKDGAFEEAPQIGCPEEIAFVFNNYPKVDISSIKIQKKQLGEAYVKLKELNIDPNKDFMIELILCDNCEKRYEFSLFSSPIPKETIREPRVMAHMFVNIKGENHNLDSDFRE